MMTKNKMAQSGFTLIELLVSLALSLVVLAFVGGIFSGSRSNQETQDDIGLLQENIRITGALFRRVVFHAGHRTLPQSATASLGTTTFGVAGTNGTSNTPGAQDTLSIAFEGDGLPSAPSGVITDCLGNSVGIGTAAQVAAAVTSGVFQRANNTFEVRTVSGRPWLGCSTADSAGTVSWTALVPDVEGMEIEFGEDSSGDAIVDRYLNAADSPSFDKIVVVRIHLLFRTAREIATSSDTTTYPLAERNYGPFNDKHIRRPLTLTIGVRNAKA
jgi:type IV pilus assembly protein PilW